MKPFVIKIGSSIIAGEGRGLDISAVERLARDISAVASRGCSVIVVSSGAVAAGMEKLGVKTRPREICLKQAAAAVGQSSLMWAYEKAFGAHGNKVAQVLLTRRDFSDRKQYINAKNTLLALLSYGVIPVINENDTVATEEIRFGDNDNLASLVSILVEAQRLIILSDVEGLYREDPRVNPHATLITSVEAITPEIEDLAGGSGSAVGTGGMYSKVLAARKATLHGIGVNIINGRRPGLILELLDGVGHGTSFSPARERPSLRKGWIAFSSRSRGSLTIDDGASHAIIGKGKSLLPSGITAVEGNFETGDSVYCLNARGKRIAKGLVNYSAPDVRKIMGRKTSEIEDVLGYKYSDEIIHRDNLVIL